MSNRRSDSKILDVRRQKRDDKSGANGATGWHKCHFLATLDGAVARNRRQHHSRDPNYHLSPSVMAEIGVQIRAAFAAKGMDVDRNSEAARMLRMICTMHVRDAKDIEKVLKARAAGHV